VKKDRQHQHIQPLTPTLMNQSEKAPDTSSDPSSMGSEARIQHLEAEVQAALERTAARTNEVLALKAKLDKPRSAHATEYNTLSEKAVKLRMDLLAILALVEGPEKHITIETEDGKAALTAVSGVLAQRKALHSDLMVLEQTAAGRAPDIALQTDIGKSAAHALSEVLTMLDTMNEQRLEGPALPLNGWSSDTARQLVEAVPPHERVLLLGDLLKQLLPHTGETGQNETASDVLKRVLMELETLTEATVPRLEQQVLDGEKERNAMAERMVRAQSAMVARRAPDAEAGGLLEEIYRLIISTGPVEAVKGAPDLIRGMLPKIVSEWRGLRAFFSEAPFVAVAVRDDGHKGPVRERYSLLVLTWDGKAVKTQVVEGTRPWGDISPYLENTVRKNLIPVAYR
jgi:hypothetical protein